MVHNRMSIIMPWRKECKNGRKGRAESEARKISKSRAGLNNLTIESNFRDKYPQNVYQK